MVTLTKQALRLLAAYRTSVPNLEWCVQISWQPGDVETFRLPNGEQGVTRGIPNGWTVGVIPYSQESAHGHTQITVSDVKVLIDAKSPPQFPFRGGVVDANGNDLYLAP